MLLHHLDGNEILRLVRERMQRDGLTQRQLAQRVRMSQGHLSRVLRGQFTGRTRVMSMLRDWATEETAGPRGVSDGEAALLKAARAASAGSDHVMQLLTEMMHCVDQARRVRRRRQAGGDG